MSKYDEKIVRIKNDHIQLLKKVRESIIKNKDHLSESLDSVITVLNVEEENTKKYQALIQAQELILSLTQEIVEADSLEQVIELRKKVNYYINKIKNELKKRESSGEVLGDYLDKVSDLRKDIAKFIRFLKRDDMIQTMESSNERYNELNEEERKMFQKLVRNELRYNARNMDSFEHGVVSKKKIVEKTEDTIVVPQDESSSENKEDTIVVSQDESSLEKKEDFDVFHFDDEPQEETESLEEYSKKLEMLFARKEEKEPVTDLDSFGFESVDETSSPIFHEEVGGRTFSFKSCKEIQLATFQEADEYLSRKALDYKKQYGILDTVDYGGSPIKNFISFLKNLPKYISNRRGIKTMKRDLSMFYRGSDLVSFYEYSKRRNSIKNGLKSIFGKTKLYGEEDLYLTKREKCSQWLYEFCKNNSMSLLVPLEYSK